MNLKDFKRLKTILKKAIEEVENKAFEQGLDIESEELQQALTKVKTRLMQKAGFSVAEYDQMEQSLTEITAKEVEQKLNKDLVESKEEAEYNTQSLRVEMEDKLKELSDRKIPTEKEIAQIANEVAKQYIKPPKVKIVKEITEVIKEPQIIREQHFEKYDDKKLKKKIKDLSKKVKGIKQVDVDKLKEDLNNRFADNFKKNINTMGMPDFRKLAMGLQQQIDDMRDGTFPSTFDYIDFDTTATYTSQEGRLGWNSDDGTLQVGMPGGNVTLQIGQETLVKAKNTSGADISNGTVVYISGASGQRPTIAKADADTEATSHGVLGLTTEDITNNQSGYVTTEGLVRDINTSAWTEGTILYLSQTAGQMTDVSPTAPAHSVIIGYVIYQHATEGIVYVHINAGGDLDSLHNVSITTPADDDILRYNNATGVWQNEALPPTTPGGANGDLQINASGAFGTIDGINLDQTGNARGTNSLDIQSYRGAVTEVANGNNSVALGYRNTASGANSAAIGTYSAYYSQGNSASGTESVAIGIGNVASNGYTAAVGNSNTASGYSSAAFGYGSTANQSGTFAFGYFASAAATNAVAIGKSITNTTANSTEIGSGSSKINIGAGGLTLFSGADVNEFSTDGTLAGNSDDAVPTEKAVKTYVDNSSTSPAGSDGDLQINNSGAFGTIGGLTLDKTGNTRGTNSLDIQTSRSAVTQVASGNKSVALGLNNTAAGDYNTLSGYYNTGNSVGNSCFGMFNTIGSGSDNSTSVGFTNTIADSCPVSTIIGSGNNAGGANSTCAGYYNNTSGSRTMSIGVRNTSAGYYSSAAGYYNYADGYGNFAIGWSNTAAGAYIDTAIGYGQTVSGTYSTAIGAAAFGSATSVSGSRSTALGYQNVITSDDGTCAGGLHNVSGNAATAIGYNNQALNLGSLALGASIGNNSSLGVAIGYQVNNYTDLTTIIGSQQGAGLNVINLNSGGLSVNNYNSLATIHSTGDVLATDVSSVGSELISNGTFTGNATGWTLGTGWAYSSNKVTKNANGTGTLSQTPTIVAGKYYVVSFYINRFSAGTMVVTIGGVSTPTLRATNNSVTTAKYQFVIKATTTGGLIFTPSNDARITTIDDVSVKEITGGNVIAPLGYVQHAVYTVATLPTVGTAGRRAMVSDANATTFASIVAAGGSNIVPVYDDGTNWRIG